MSRISAGVIFLSILILANYGTAAAGECNRKNTEHQIQLDPERLLHFFKKGTEDIYFVNLSRCFVQGTRVKVYEVRPKAKDAYYKILLDEAKVTETSYVTLPELRKRQIDPKELSDLSQKVQKQVRKAGGGNPDEKKIFFARYKSTTWKIEDAPLGMPLQHPQAEIAVDQFLDGKKSAGFIYDLRPLPMRQRQPLPTSLGAAPLDLENVRELARGILRPGELPSSLQKLNLGRPSKDDPLYLISECPGEYLAYNVVSFFAVQAYTKIFWFPKGAVGLPGLALPSCETPVDAPLIIHPKEVLAALKSKALVLDVRDRLKLTRIDGSKPAPFRQQSDELGVASLRGKLTAAKILEASEGFQNLALPTKGRLVILYGENPYDWRPYKAALILKAEGYRVKWYRDGMQSWINLHRFYPDKYGIAE